MLEEADNLFYRISTNSSLLDKLRKDLIEAKYRYGMCQTDLANAENDSIKLKKTKDSQSLNFGEIVSDLVSIVFEEYKDSGEQNEVEALQTFAGLLTKINSAVESGSNFKIEFTFMNSEDTATRAVVRNSGDREKLIPLTGDKFDKSSIESQRMVQTHFLFLQIERTTHNREPPKVPDTGRASRRRYRSPGEARPSSGEMQLEQRAEGSARASEAQIPSDVAATEALEELHLQPRRHYEKDIRDVQRYPQQAEGAFRRSFRQPTADHSCPQPNPRAVQG